jgi:hypothetical protein
MSRKIFVSLELDARELAEGLVLSSLSHEELQDLIINIDLGVADLGFSEGVLLKLIESIGKEYQSPSSPEEELVSERWSQAVALIKSLVEDEPA